MLYCSISSGYIKLWLTSKIFDVVGIWNSKCQGENIISYNILILDITKRVELAIFCRKEAVQYIDLQNRFFVLTIKFECFDTRLFS